jgi:serine protease Do
MGHPGGFQFDRTPPVRLGRLWEKADDKYHRTDCTVSGGDSGGPLFNLEGKIVGIHSSIGQRLEENRHVPIGAFKESWERLSKGEGWGNLGKLMPELERFDRPHSKDKAKPQSKPEARETPKPKSKPAPQMIPEAEQTLDRPDLGVALDPKSEAAAKVTSVRPDSPAEQAGFQEGDVIEKVDGAEISSPGAFIEAIQARKPGDSVKFSILRDGKDISLQAKLGRRSE